MKLGKSTLLEIVAIVQDGIATGTDVSQMLRDIELREVDGLVELVEDYKRDSLLEEWPEEPQA